MLMDRKPGQLGISIEANDFPPDSSKATPDGQVDDSHEGTSGEHLLQVQIASSNVHSSLPRGIVGDAAK